MSYPDLTKVLLTFKMSYAFTAQVQTYFHLHLQEKYGPAHADFHKTHKCSRVLSADFLCQILPKSDKKCGK
jgi:hypothetical protein